MDSVVYHYCDQEAFLKIISNREFWFGETSLMNDPTENKVFIQQCRKILNQRKIKENEFFNLKKDTRLFTLSFSKKDSILGWREYADGGNGFAIGIKIENTKAKKIESFNDIDWSLQIGNEGFHNDRLYLDYVIYNAAKQRKLVSKLIDEFYNVKVENGLLDTSIKLVNTSIFLSAIFKHQAYKIENECRMFLTEDNFWDFSHPFFINSKYGMREFQKRDFKALFKDDMNPIVDVLIGPNNNLDLKFVERFLSHNNIKCAVWKSEIPMR